MKKGCLYGLGCLVVLAVLPVLVPSALVGLLWLLTAIEVLLRRI